MPLNKGNYQYKGLAFEISEATTLKDIEWVLNKYPELKTVVGVNDSKERANKRKSKTKSK